MSLRHFGKHCFELGVCNVLGIFFWFGVETAFAHTEFFLIELVVNILKRGMFPIKKKI